MAFFPAEALIRLYEVLGDIRELMSWLALATQGLVVIAMLAGVMAILTLHRRQFAVLRALGAPRLYIFLCVWRQIAVIAVAGALLGLLLGAGAAVAVSHMITRATGIVLPARIGPDELRAGRRHDRLRPDRRDRAGLHQLSPLRDPGPHRAMRDDIADDRHSRAACNRNMKIAIARRLGSLNGTTTLRFRNRL